MFELQGSLLDLDSELGLQKLGDGLARVPLSHGAWVDLRPGWLTGADELFDRLSVGGSAGVDWRSEERTMWDKRVMTPRLLRFYGEDENWPDPILVEARDQLSEHYAAELGEQFTTAGMCLYRDGQDSVAWHGDREGRSRTQDTMVAIISIGSARTLALRPVEGGESHRYRLGHGDLIVMGGSCQRTWDHAIPKTRKPVGPRISIQFRPPGVR